MPQPSGAKKRTGFGPHPEGRDAKPDAAETQVPHETFPPAVTHDASGTLTGQSVFNVSA